MRRSNVDDVRGQMKEKNKELSEYLNEIKELQSANDLLQNEVEKVKGEMQDATSEIEETTRQYCSLKVFSIYFMIGFFHLLKPFRARNNIMAPLQGCHNTFTL